MASALQLAAAATIINGQGIAVNGTLGAAINSFQANDTVSLVNTAFATAKAAGNVAAKNNLLAQLELLGSGVTSQNKWLIDFYPTGTTPVCSGAVTLYGTTTATASLGSTIRTQSALPFSNGMAGFANVYSTVSGYSASTFDTVSSVQLLRGQTYDDSGLQYTSPLDLATGGIGAVANVIIRTIQGWGTMYDIQNMSTFGDPYVFGQNLLNQNLGRYGNWDAQLADAGLNTSNLTAIPDNATYTAQVAGSLTTSSPIGSISLPFVETVTATRVVSGNSADVVLAIYANVTGANLTAIQTATSVTSDKSRISTLADYLNFDKAIDAGVLTELKALGVTDFPSLGKFIQSRLGNGAFQTWAKTATFLGNIEIPQYASPATTSTTSQSQILPTNLADALSGIGESGQGDFKNPLAIDFMGACSGTPYAPSWLQINANYDKIDTSALNTALTTLNTTITTYLTEYDLYVSDPGTYPEPDITPVTNAVTAANSTLNAISNPVIPQTQELIDYMLLMMSGEVSRLYNAGVTFGPAGVKVLQNFALRIGSIAADKTKFQAYQFFANLITGDENGDRIRSAVTETINSALLASKGIPLSNDPAPDDIIRQSQTQGIPISTYISQNK